MKTLTRKSELLSELDHCFRCYSPDKGCADFITELNNRLLQRKVKFPLLEHAGTRIYEKMPHPQHISITDKIAALQTEGGNVIIGMILQHRLAGHFDESIQMAANYISRADAWYVPDIIGERVWGWGLLHYPEKTLAAFRDLKQHESHWVVRSLGAGAHNAIKNGLEPAHVERLFAILISLASAKDHHVKTGIGWAAKTAARLHPDIIDSFKTQLEGETAGQWFCSKIEKGRKRSDHAQGN